jgi:hypothetical protein
MEDDDDAFFADMQVTLEERVARIGSSSTQQARHPMKARNSIPLFFAQFRREIERGEENGPARKKLEQVVIFQSPTV